MNGWRELAALVTIMVWPVVPLFWVPVHGLPRLVRRLGYFSYAIPLVTWLPLLYLIYRCRHLLLLWRTGPSILLELPGWIFFVAGTGLHIWTGSLLGLRGLIGIPEIMPRSGGRLVTSGPFSVVRHPTYLAHTLMFLGVFLISGVVSLGIITLFDLAVINMVVIPLEDKELENRFRGEYDEYRKRVPAFLQRLFR